jgi:hypothetical protein
MSAGTVAPVTGDSLKDNRPIAAAIDLQLRRIAAQARAIRHDLDDPPVEDERQSYCLERAYSGFSPEFIDGW